MSPYVICMLLISQLADTGKKGRVIGRHSRVSPRAPRYLNPSLIVFTMYMSGWVTVYVGPG